jgi:hypothetical protein
MPICSFLLIQNGEHFFAVLGVFNDDQTLQAGNLGSTGE